MKLTRTAAIVLAILGVLPTLQAQAPAGLDSSQATDKQQAPVFRAGVELVRLDVRVVDEQGLPIRDLKVEDLVVEEAGQQRPIVLFQHVAEPSGTYLDVARRTIGAEVSTNQGSPRGHLYVFIFDQNHITLGNEQRARAAVERFLRTRVRPGDRVALYAIPGPGPQLGFTSNLSLPLAELSKVRGMLDRQAAVGIAPMSQFEAYQIARGDQNVLQRVLVRSSEASTALDVSGRTSRARTTTGVAGATDSGETLTQASQLVADAARSVVGTADGESRVFLNSLSDIIRQLAPIEGRKAVILVSEGFFADNLSRDVDVVAAAAAEAYAVIYSLDINRRGSDPSAGEPVGGDQASEILGRIESLGALSAETSGELIVDASGQVDAALNRIASSSQDYYIVGFEPPARALEDRRNYRRVKVRVLRPGARVASRTGYALRDPVGSADRRRAIDTALSAPFPQQGLPLEMTTYVLRGTSPGAQRVFLSLQAELPVAGSQPSAAADVVFVARSASDGRVRASGTDTIPLPRTPAEGKSTATGFFNVQFDLPAGEYLMRAVVREPGGATGTVDRRFEVRALDGADVTASDLIIGHSPERLPVRPKAFVEEGLVGALEIYARNPSDLGSAEVTLDLFTAGGDSPVRSIRADIDDTRPMGGGGARRANIAMPLAGVTPGEYVARATVRANNETVTELIRQVQILAGRAPAPAANAVQERVSPAMIAGGDLGQRLIAILQRAPEVPSVPAAAELASAGEWEKALSVLGPHNEGQPAGVHTLRGLALFALGRTDAAGASMEKAWSLDSTSSLTAFFLGWIRSTSGRQADAISAWRAAVSLDRTLVPAYLALAQTYLQLSHPELAVQALEEGLRHVPGSPELGSRLSEIKGR